MNSSAISARAGLRAHRRLVVICALAAVLETILVGAFAPASSLGLATQISAPPPFGVFHDLRWIVVYHESWLGLGAELVAFLGFRGGMTALCLRAAWPDGVPRERWSVTVRRSLAFTAVAGVLLVPWAALMFALAVVSLSWLFFVAVPSVLMLALLVHGGAVIDSWWSRTLSARSLGWVLVAFVALTVSGSILTTCPPWARVPAAALAGVVNAYLWLRVVDAVLCRNATPRPIPVAPLGIVGVFVLVIAGTVWGFALSRSPVSAAARAAASGASWVPVQATGDAPLVVVTGFNTSWDGRPHRYVRADLPQQRFSYRGMAGAVPRPYTAEDTHRALPVLVRELRRQVDAYHRETGRLPTIVAESEGALVAKTYLAATPRAPVRNLVLLSPLVAPGRVYYPAGGTEGWGAGGALALEGFARALSGLSPVDVSADTPFFRSIVDDAPALHGLMGCSLPRVRQFAVLPLDTAVTAPEPGALGIPYTVVPAFHGGMLDDDTTAAVVRRVVARKPLPGDDGWSLAERLIESGAAAWQVPQLAPELNLAWEHGPDPGDCRAIRRHLRSEMA